MISLYHWNVKLAIVSSAFVPFPAHTAPLRHFFQWGLYRVQSAAWSYQFNIKKQQDLYRLLHKDLPKSQCIRTQTSVPVKFHDVSDYAS